MACTTCLNNNIKTTQNNDFNTSLNESLRTALDARTSLNSVNELNRFVAFNNTVPQTCNSMQNLMNKLNRPSACGIKRIVQINMPMTFKEVKIENEKGNDITLSSLYSWSTDTLCWSSYTEYNTYKKVAQNIDGDYYLRILIFDSLSKIYLNNFIIECYSISLYNENIFLQSFCNNVNLFNPYANLDCALLLQTQLADSIICMLGLPCYYFKVAPNADTIDYTFKEYVLHEVKDVKIIKLMVQDGQLPSSKPQMTELDFDWDNDWEVEISKTQFAQAFGDTAFPKERDFVYIPFMKRLYDINSAYDEKNEGLMWRPTTWKLALVKHDEKTNVDENDFEELIDTFMVNKYEDVFHEKELVEQERESGAAQVETIAYAPTNLTNIFMSDNVRLQISSDDMTSFINSQLNQSSAIVAKNMYDFKHFDSRVIYQNKYCGEDGILSFIINVKDDLLLPIDELMAMQGITPDQVSDLIYLNEYGKFSKKLLQIGDIIVSIDNVLNGSVISFCGIPGPLLNSGSIYCCIARWNRKSFFYDFNMYEYKLQPKYEDVPLFRRRPDMYYFDFDNSYIEDNTQSYNDRFINKSKTLVQCSPYPLDMTNIKLYEVCLDIKDAINEVVKYSTTNKDCVLNDTARPIEISHGYSIR